MSEAPTAATPGRLHTHSQTLTHTPNTHVNIKVFTIVRAVQQRTVAQAELQQGRVGGSQGTGVHEDAVGVSAGDFGEAVRDEEVRFGVWGLGFGVWGFDGTCL